ncbi:MAG TPA: nitroreductase family protein [Acidimicrobiia bacterium]|nr:nitroreductase family protein [Acidimicrobiia bacterium]
MTEFREVLRRRRMVRNYLDQPVDPNALERIVEAGTRAPSAGYTQGQSFVIVTDPERRGRIAELAGEPEYVARGFDPWISRAPVHIAVCVSEAAYHARYREPDKLDADGNEIEWPIPYWWVDAGASLMAILLAAVDEGVAAGFLGVQSFDGLAEFLELPDTVTPIGIVTIGHPARDRRSGSLDRGPRTDSVHRERWGG